MQIDRRRKLKESHIEKLDELMRRTGMKLHKIAAEAGLTGSTLYNVYDPDKPNVLSSDSLDKLDQRFPEDMSEASANGTGPGFHEPEAVRLSDDLISKDLRPCHPGQSVWRLQTRALELPPYGLQPGTHVLIDDRVQPSRSQPYDIVCANTSSGQTIWRVFVMPYYLLTATADGSIPATPFIVGHDAAIMGTVIKTLTSREQQLVDV